MVKINRVVKLISAKIAVVFECETENSLAVPLPRRSRACLFKASELLLCAYRALGHRVKLLLKITELFLKCCILVTFSK
jgi:hypothetical protein